MCTLQKPTGTKPSDSLPIDHVRQHNSFRSSPADDRFVAGAETELRVLSMVLNEYMTPSLARAARAILNWSMTDLAQRTGVAATTIRNYESGKRDTTRVNRATISAAFQEEGIDFIGGEATLPGLVLTRPELLNNPPPARTYRSR